MPRIIITYKGNKKRFNELSSEIGDELTISGFEPDICRTKYWENKGSGLIVYSYSQRIDLDNENLEKLLKDFGLESVYVG